MERVTATFDKATLRAIRKVAGRRGVSRFLQVAARERLARLEVLALLDDLDERYGSVPDAIMNEVAAEAVGNGAPAVVLTSDPDDLERLLVDAKDVAVRRV